MMRLTQALPAGPSKFARLGPVLSVIYNMCCISRGGATKI